MTYTSLNRRAVLAGAASAVAIASAGRGSLAIEHVREVGCHRWIDRLHHRDLHQLALACF